MPDPDGVIQNRDLADGIIDSRVLADPVAADPVQITNFTVEDTLQAAIIRTDTIGDFLFLQKGNMRMFTGNSLEGLSGLLRPLASGTGGATTLQTELASPNWNSSGRASLTIRSASDDDSTSPPGWVFTYTGDSAQTAEVILQAVDLRVQGVGKATIEGELVIPAVTSDPSSPADGNMWLHTVDNALYIWEGGARRTVASW